MTNAFPRFPLRPQAQTRKLYFPPFFSVVHVQSMQVGGYLHYIALRRSRLPSREKVPFDTELEIIARARFNTDPTVTGVARVWLQVVAGVSELLATAAEDALKDGLCGEFEALDG